MPRRGSGAARGGAAAPACRSSSTPESISTSAISASEAQLAAAIERGRAYLAAGADSIYPIGLRDEPTIKRLGRGAECPININVRAGYPDVAELEALGVAAASPPRPADPAGAQRVRDAVRDIRAQRPFRRDQPRASPAPEMQQALDEK